MENGIKEAVRPFLGDKRYRHTLSVEAESERLAKIYVLSDEDTVKLKNAALLHDITKELSIVEQLALCSRFGITVKEEDKLSPKIFHAKTGAYLAQADFPSAVDCVVFGCIRWHTTGRAAMTLPEKLLYLADYIEPTRDFADCVELRKYFYSELESGNIEKFILLDRTLILSFDLTIRGLLGEGKIIDADTVESRNYLLAGALNER